MKHQALLSSIEKGKKKVKVSSAAILLGSLRVNHFWFSSRKDQLEEQQLV